MKKPKFKLDGAAIQKFLVLHCEKLVLVAVLGVMAWLVYMGYSLPGLDADKTPAALAKKSDQTRTFIDEPTRWTAVVSVDRQTPMDLESRAEESQHDNDPSKYLVPVPWRPEMFPKLSPRTDPVLLPPQHLIVHPVVGPIFSNLQSEEELDPTYPVEPEDATTPTKKPPTKAKKPPRTTAASGYGYSSSDAAEMGGAEGYGASGYPGGRGSRRARRSSSSDVASDMPGAARGGSSASGMQSGMMSGGYGYGAQVGGINPESVFGYPGNGQMGVGRNGHAMVITAVVPFEKQLEEFANALNSSLDYDVQRDQPRYVGLVVWRAEVPPNQLAADPETLRWDSISVKGTLNEQLGTMTPKPTPGQWAGVPSEVVDPMYRDPTLTCPAPPFMQRDLWPLLTHPDVPLAPLANAGMYNESMRPLAPAPGGGNNPPVEDVPTAPSGTVPGYSGGYGDSAEGGYGGMAMAGGSMSGMGAMRSPLTSGSSGMSSGMGSSGMGMMSSGSGYGASSGYGYGGYGEGMSAMTIAPPKFKLVRFTDTHVEPGKYYRYKVKVQLHDPNHPWMTYAPPTLASLDEKVQKRIKALDEQDAKSKTPNTRTFWVESDWSQPSDVVTLPSRSSFYAGTVDQPGMAEIVPGKPRVANSQPSVKVLTSVWDPVKVADFPAEELAYRGSVLNFSKDAKVIHPLNHDVVDFKEYKFQTGAIIGDLAGGDSIPKRNKSNAADPLKAPGELVVIDEHGQLRVRHETDDIEEFRRRLVPPEPKTPTPAEGAEGYGSYGETPGYGPPGAMRSSGPGYGGSSGGSRPPRSSGGRSGP
jgi:hypothetical protein